MNGPRDYRDVQWGVESTIHGFVPQDAVEPIDVEPMEDHHIRLTYRDGQQWLVTIQVDKQVSNAPPTR